MAYERKIVLHCPNGYHPRLVAMVEQFANDGVVFVGVVGQDCARIEDIIDEILVGDGSNRSYDMLTSSHPGDTIEGAIEFARSLPLEFAGDVEVVEL